MDSKTTSDDRSKECNDASDVADEVVSHVGNLGGDAVIHVPPTVAEALDVDIGETVSIEVEADRAVLRAGRPSDAEGRR